MNKRQYKKQQKKERVMYPCYVSTYKDYKKIIRDYKNYCRLCGYKPIESEKF